MDLRLLQAYELLRELVSGTAREAARTPSSFAQPRSSGAPLSLQTLEELWPEEVGATTLPSVLASTTDLLVPWAPQALPEAAPGSPVGESTHPPRSPSPTRGAREAEMAAATTGLGALTENGDEPQMSDDDAEAVVDMLFDFIHSLERREVEQAMEAVASDFRAMEGDDEVDRDIFRQVLERFFDERPGELRLSLARVPEPVAHRLGVLVHVLLQVEPDPDAGSALVEGVVVFRQDPLDEWKITGFKRLDR